MIKSLNKDHLFSTLYGLGVQTKQL